MPSPKKSPTLWNADERDQVSLKQLIRSELLGMCCEGLEFEILAVVHFVGKYFLEICANSYKFAQISNKYSRIRTNLLEKYPTKCTLAQSSINNFPSNFTVAKTSIHILYSIPNATELKSSSPFAEHCIMNAFQAKNTPNTSKAFISSLTGASVRKFN